MPKRIRSTPQGTDRAKSGSIQDVQEFEVRVDRFRAFQMKDGSQCVVVHALLDIVDIPADANATLRLLSMRRRSETMLSTVFRAGSVSRTDVGRASPPPLEKARRPRLRRCRLISEARGRRLRTILLRNLRGGPFEDRDGPFRRLRGRRGWDPRRRAGEAAAERHYGRRRSARAVAKSSRRFSLRADRPSQSAIARSLQPDGRLLVRGSRGAPYGNRTRVSAVKGRRPRPLDEGRLRRGDI